MIDRRDGILPDEGFLGHFGAEVAGHRTHVAVGQLIPSLGEGLLELLGILEEALRDLGVFGIHLQGHVGGEHDGLMALRGIVGIGHGALAGAVLGNPLFGSGGAGGQLPVVGPEIGEIHVRPTGRRARPCAFEAARDGVAGVAFAVFVFPAEALLLERGTFGFGTDVAFGGGGSVGFAEGVAACDEGDRFLIVHRHAGEGFADIVRRGKGIGIAVRSLGIHIDEPHLHGGEGILEFPSLTVALVAEPFGFGTPVDILLWFPDVCATTGEAVGLEAHRFEGDVAGQDHEIGPRDFLAVLLLDGPEKTACLVEVGVVGPAVERGETLGAVGGSAASIGDPVGPGAVPGHADEEGTIVTVVGGPPILRGGHELGEILLQGGEVELLELLGVVEAFTHRIALGGILMKHAEIQLIRPPVSDRHRPGGGVTVGSGGLGAHHGAFAEVVHGFCGFTRFRCVLGAQ